MRNVLAIALSLALAFPAASLMAQQAPAKVQPVQVAQTGGSEAGLMGMSMGATIAVVAALALVVVAANSNDDVTPVATATGTR
jgi:dienelactone hydrolase